MNAETEIRAALAAEPTPGPWFAPYGGGLEGPNDSTVAQGDYEHDVFFPLEATRQYVAACNPANIAALLAELDARQAKIAELGQDNKKLLAVLSGVTRGWQFWDGSYEKQSYDVWVKGGDVVLGCWPNAGKMAAVDGSGRSWTPDAVLAVRVSEFQGRFPRLSKAAAAPPGLCLDSGEFVPADELNKGLQDDN